MYMYMYMCMYAVSRGRADTHSSFLQYQVVTVVLSIDGPVYRSGEISGRARTTLIEGEWTRNTETCSGGWLTVCMLKISRFMDIGHGIELRWVVESYSTSVEALYDTSGGGPKR